MRMGCYLWLLGNCGTASKGCSIRKINSLTGVSRDAISRLAHYIAGQHTNDLYDELARYRNDGEAQLDQQQTFMMKK